MSSRYFEGAKHVFNYAKFRPSPPASLIDAIIEFTKAKVPGGELQSCIDVGCGSGQSTPCLSPYFSKVLGVDVSPAQIEAANATEKPSNVSYEVCQAEKLPLDAASVQLVTACQACHWFDMPTFFSETDRILVPGGVVALYSYRMPTFKHPKAEEALSVIQQFYDVELKGCWAPERVDVDEGYIAERFNIPYPDFFRDYNFSLERSVTARDVRGWLSSWSGYSQYCKQNGEEQGEAALNKVADSVAFTVLCSCQCSVHCSMLVSVAPQRTAKHLLGTGGLRET
ncbi:Methyltransferase type 11 [Trinorchestia longiramus]|nr:Methyltransferase type 11 [Trinorchestia longiramus]